ncbi:hypothetical protein NECAME_10124 [Necator americanus]|uniref:Uncharacterized protein n=1 Tax=Necator americanus TaxID=51031 RepID=W2T9V2_NECAM|nr:hypothetical protein NECAME_10124 [Necator americanus]ETN78790.1 hypothetical protein NECAME_10124 [Necator americanus]
MFEKFLLCLIIVIAVISFVSADFSCFFGDTICKSITCRKISFPTVLLRWMELLFPGLKQTRAALSLPASMENVCALFAVKRNG